jgi:hypothetical protein
MHPAKFPATLALHRGRATYLLFSVENTTGQRFEWTRWSCVFFDRGNPVYEEQSIVENVQPRSRAVQRVIQGYGGPFDKTECRFMDSRPKTPETAEQLEPRGTRPRGSPQDYMGRFVSKVLGSTELQWKQIFATDGRGPSRR